MKKLLIIPVLMLVLASCKKDKGCYNCVNVHQDVVETYCDMTQAEADAKSALRNTIELQRLSNSVMSEETRRNEERRITIVRCIKKN